MTPIEEYYEQEKKRIKEWERTTVVTLEGETVADLREAFELVCDKEHWKKPWKRVVPKELADRVCRAVEFFHADKPEILVEPQHTGDVLLVGKGYQAY